MGRPEGGKGAGGKGGAGSAAPLLSPSEMAVALRLREAFGGVVPLEVSR